MSYAGHAVQEFVPTVLTLAPAEEGDSGRMPRPIASAEVELDTMEVARALKPMATCLEDLWPTED